MHLKLFSANSFRTYKRETTRGGLPGTATHVVVSVLAGNCHAEDSSNAVRSQADTTMALRALLDELQIPATWAIERVGSSLHGAPLLEALSAEGHEVALLVRPTWSRPVSRRAVIANAIAKHASKAARLGVRITTLFGDASLMDGNDDLLVKRGITAVCAASRPSAATRYSQPRQRRYGLWDHSVHVHLPSDRGWQGAPSLPGRRTFQHMGAGKQGGTLHAAIDATQLARDPRSHWRPVELVLRRLARHRGQHPLHFETVTSATRRLSEVPAPSPQRSILRRAA